MHLRRAHRLHRARHGWGVREEPAVTFKIDIDTSGLRDLTTVIECTDCKRSISVKMGQSSARCLCGRTIEISYEEDNAIRIGRR